ncbi:alpha/beta fold hydrolase [Natrialbaceae archaeon A-CW2]|uniref:alpha/beta fold hydrolase n=1 Tax=Natronosalvus amylolyticus TaxID=2961994 RepID=UPI0020C99363|nr:alpha/beta hydrolase [Natronosalvus amylolyticus]
MNESTAPDETTEKKIVTSADGTEIAFTRTGSGPPLVLVHCASADHRIWELFDVRSILAEDTTVYAIDRRGRGESGDAEAYEPDREFEDVAAVVESIDEPVTLLGHSAGGFYSLEAALRTDNLSGLVLYEPAFFVDRSDVSDADRIEMMSLLEAGELEEGYVFFIEEIAGWTSEELDVVRSAPTWEEYVERFPTLLPKYARIPEYEFDPARFADVTTPTLLLTGSESPEWYRSTTEAVNDALSNTHVVTFDGHGHAGPLTAPDRFTDEVLSFVNEPA